MVVLLRPPADCTASASGRCLLPAARRRPSVMIDHLTYRTTLHTLHHASPGTSVLPSSAPLQKHSRRKLLLVRASVAELETSAEAVRGRQGAGSLGALPAVHPVQLPQELRDMVRSSTAHRLEDHVAILVAPNLAAPNGLTTVYVLGMSHVSRRSCQDIEQLISTVRPDIVLVELCKDRVTGLISEEQVDVRRQHVKRVRLTGCPKEEGWPAPEQVLALCRTRPGFPVTFQDIEQDSARVLSTGLFKSARPFVRPPRSTKEMYPQFLLDDASGALKALRPLGETEFLVTPRELPQLMSFDARLDSSLRGPLAALATSGVATASADLSAALSSIAADTLAAARPARRQQAPAAATVEAAVSEDAAKEDAGAKDGAIKSEEGIEQEDSSQPKRVEAPSTINLLMQARSRLMGAGERGGLARGSFEVLFSGLEEGRVEAALHAVPPGSQPLLTGLESSVVHGEGFGIEPFRSPGELIEVGISMKVPLDKVADNLPPTEKPFPVSATDACVSGYRGLGTHLQLWQEATSAEAADSGEEEEAAEVAADDPLAGAGGWLAQELTAIYAGYQEGAGKSAGVEAGEPWQVAFRAAAAAGTAQVHLGDRPSDITARKMSDGVWSALAGPLLTSAALIMGCAVGSFNGAIPGDLRAAAAGLSLAAVAVALAPVVGPILEVRQLSRLPAAEVEAAVRPKEPLQNADGAGLVKLTGEDALLDWPNAMAPVIEERDAYMARTLWAAATGAPGTSPAFVADSTIDGRTIFRYAMPKDGPEGACTAGAGDGEYKPLAAPAAVVAVVGTAHVRGIIRNWKKAASDTSLERYLTL